MKLHAAGFVHVCALCGPAAESVSKRAIDRAGGWMGPLADAMYGTQGAGCITQTLGGTARWLQLQPLSAWPRPTVSAFQYFRWCALTTPAVSHFLRQIYSLSKEEAL